MKHSTNYRGRLTGLIAAALATAAVSVTLLSQGASATPGHTDPHFPAATPKVSRAVADTPYAKLPKVPSFSLKSTDVATGKQLGTAQTSGNTSPQLSWKGFPKGTKSFVVSMYDQDAGTGSGFWHWAAYNLPASTTTLKSGAGAPGGAGLPAGTVQAPNDASVAGYVGAAPPAGQTHRYFITVYALDTATVQLPPTASPALVGASIGSHILARGTLVPLAKG
ncbi:YbhB/YbcL family Raf kinase inhibitor-like protein [Streptomyces sp. NBC_00459]|uniref:YbhB/YbcL family Raf kinase inhibitor-like protein n=1 Tax=Streptomyces sp. NBC_00459 TaxID=2975749 RepID=UPI002E1775DA